MNANGDIPLVSIIVPTYNRSRLLREAVESALTQTYPNVEVIVVDDGSTDNTPEVMARYGERIRYIRQANRGVAAARNAGIRTAKGRYLAFLDDDDLFLPDKIKRQVRALAEQPNSGLVHCRYYRADSEGSYLDKPGLLPQGNVLSMLVQWNFVWVGGPLIRRECFERVGLFAEDGPSVTADWDMWLRIALAGYEFGCVQRPVGVYRIHSQSMMANVGNVERGTMHVLEKAFADPALPDSVRASKPQALAIVRVWLGCLYYNAGRWDDGRRNLALAAELHPLLLNQPAQITQFLCNTALSHRIADPPQFVADVLDHLPANAMSLQRYRPYILNRLYTQLALQSYSTGEIAQAQKQLCRAMDLSASMAAQAQSFSDLLAHAALHLPIQDPIRYISFVLRNLPSRARPFRRLRGWTMNRAHLKLAREASLAGARRRAIGHIASAIVYRPFSRRTWKLGLMFMRWLADKRTVRTANESFGRQEKPSEKKRIFIKTKKALG